MSAEIIDLERARLARANRRLNSHWADEIETGRRIARKRLTRLLDAAEREAELNLMRLFDCDDLPPGGHAA